MGKEHTYAVLTVIFVPMLYAGESRRPNETGNKKPPKSVVLIKQIRNNCRPNATHPDSALSA